MTHLHMTKAFLKKANFNKQIFINSRNEMLGALEEAEC